MVVILMYVLTELGHVLKCPVKEKKNVVLNMILQSRAKTQQQIKMA